MNRISFLKRLIASLFGAAIIKPASASETQAAAALQPTNARYLLSATVAGLPYYQFPTYGANLLGEGEDIYTSIANEYTEHLAQLVLEPSNEFDYKAIEVYCHGYKMGYIPRQHNKVLYNLLKDGAQLKANVRLHVKDTIDPDILYTYDFEYMYDLRIRVYLLTEPIAVVG